MWWIKRRSTLKNNRFQEPYNEKSFNKIKRLKSLKKVEVYLEPMPAFTMGGFFVNLLNGFILSQYKFHHRSSTGLYIGLWRYWDFQSEQGGANHGDCYNT